METLEEKIAALEQEIRETPYHKGTQHHIGRLRAKIARLKEEIIQREIKGGGGGGGGLPADRQGFAQRKFGDATVVLVGLPSVGKSTLLNKLTHAHAKVAAYDFTTLEVIPGMLDYQGAKIQIFDIPGIVGGAAKGKGRGREILSVARVADLLILMTDIATSDQLEKIQKELYEAGLRLNRQSSPITINRKMKGGIRVISSSLPSETVKEIAKEFRLTNAEILLQGKLTENELIDALLGNRVYLPSLTVLNKIDLLSPGDLTSLFHSLENKAPVIPISAEKGIGLEDLKKTIWEKLELFRIFLKPQGQKPDLENPLIIKKGDTVLAAGRKIHGELAQNIKRARIWGKSAKFPGQSVGLAHQLEDEDILTLIP